MQWTAEFYARFYGPKEEIEKLSPAMAEIYAKNKKGSSQTYRRVIELLMQNLIIPKSVQASGSDICIGFDEIEAVEMEDGVMYALWELEKAVPNVSMAILDRNENYLNYKFFSPYGQCVMENCFSGNVENFPELDWIPQEWRELESEEEFDYADMVYSALKSFNYIPYNLTDKSKEKTMSAIQGYIDEHDEEFSYFVPDGCSSYSNMYGIMEMNIEEAKSYLKNKGNTIDEDDPCMQLAMDIIQNLAPKLKNL